MSLVNADYDCNSNLTKAQDRKLENAISHDSKAEN